MCICLINLRWNSGNAATSFFSQWYLSIALIIPACSLSRGQTLSSVLSTVQPVLSHKADCHPGIVLELETVLFLHADLLLDVCCAKR